MLFYKVQTDQGPQLVGTQAEVKRLKQTIQEENVPTDKEGLMNYINVLLQQEKSFHDILQEAQEEVEEETVEVVPRKDNSATAILARIDAPPGVDTDAIVEAIFKAKGYVLARFAKSVAMAYEKLGG